MPTNATRVSVRCYVLETMPWGPAKRVLFVELRSVTADDLNDNPYPFSAENIELLRQYPKHIIEVEFLDVEDRNQRYLRFGTDPRIMVAPMIQGNPESDPLAHSYEPIAELTLDAARALAEDILSVAGSPEQVLDSIRRIARRPQPAEAGDMEQETPSDKKG